MPFSAGILTVSDRGAAGEREDTSGAEIRRLLSGLDVSIERYEVIPDERAAITARLIEWADGTALDLIVTTGGTGLGPRDVTPQATLDAIDHEAPGLAEAIRLEGLKQTPMAMLSRAVAGVRGRTLIVNLPGSPKGVRESLSVLLPVLPHALETLRGRTEHREHRRTTLKEGQGEVAQVTTAKRRMRWGKKSRMVEKELLAQALKDRKTGTLYLRSFAPVAERCGVTREFVRQVAEDLNIKSYYRHLTTRGSRSMTDGQRTGGGKAPDIGTINSYIQKRLTVEGVDCVSAVEAGHWLDEAGLLKDSDDRPGKPLRDLLRGGLIRGARQDPPKAHGRWSICRNPVRVKSALSKQEPGVPRSAKAANRLPPSLRAGVDLVIVGVGPKPGGRSLRLGCYYADGRNSFWRDLYESGFTLSLFEPCDYPRLLDIVPSIGLDDLNDDAEGVWERLQECRPRVVVFNSKEARKSAQRDHYGRQILNAFECHALHDSSGRSAGSYRPQRLAALRALRRRFP